MQLTEKEKSMVKELPGCLIALADWHDTQEVMADAMGLNDTATQHSNRSMELNKEAKRIQEEWEN